MIRSMPQGHIGWSSRVGVFEHFYPETSDMTEPEFYQLIDGLNANAGVRNQILSQIAEVYSERGSDG